jgi:structural maintenance of chromosome 4
VKEIGPFHKSFSSVVGPNGSGKSNVIDAMLFVFGKKASKLRLNKVSELIHKSAEYPSLDMARVTVFFQDILDVPGDADAYTAVPGSQFTVTRSAWRDNSSKYYVNGKGSSFTEVTALLNGKGIDLDNNRFLILQGEVELISQMKPKAPSPHEDGLLEYLEDIIGSKAFVERIEEQGKVCEDLTEKRGEALKRVQLAEKDVGALACAKAEAEALLAKERACLRTSATIAAKVLAQTREALAPAAALAAERAAAAAAAGDAARAAAAEFDAAEVAEAAAARAAGAAGDAAERAAAKYGEASARFAGLTADIVGATNAAKRAGEAERGARDKLGEATRAGAAAEAAAPKLAERQATLGRDLALEEAAKEAVAAGLRGETEGLRGEMEAAQAALAPLAEAEAAARGAAAAARTERKLLKERMDAASGAAAALRVKAEGLAAREGAAAAEAAAAGGELKTASARRAVAEAALPGAAEAEARAGGAARAARGALEEGRARAAAAAAGGRGAGNAQADALKAAARRGGPLERAGFHGRLGDLGAIAPEYDAAVTTAVRFFYCVLRARARAAHPLA